VCACKTERRYRCVLQRVAACCSVDRLERASSRMCVTLCCTFVLHCFSGLSCTLLQMCIALCCRCVERVEREKKRKRRYRLVSERCEGPDARARAREREGKRERVSPARDESEFE